MKTASQHSFAQVPRADIQRSSFDRTHGYKTTIDAGYLIPFFVDEALPGDTFSLNATLFGRLATPIHPVMDNMYLDTQFFAVPLRLVWDNFQRFMGEQPNPDDSTDYLIPQITHTCQPGSIYDYFGLPTTTVNPIEFSALFLRAYNLIWNEWYRDENLQDRATELKGDGPDAPNVYALKKRGKRHDYFTSCLPWPQKGPTVTIPIGTSAPIKGNGQITYVHNANDATNRALYHNADAVIKTTANPTAAGNMMFSTNYNQVGLEVDLNVATNATINQLREAFQIQRLYERDARGGTRYTEIIRSHFGVVSPDARLQRPEYLGGGSTRVNITPVPQTQESTSTSPQGSLAGYGTASASGHGFSKSFTEHTILIGLVSLRADLNYQQGINKMWSRQTRFDFFWPALSHLGEQAVLNKEIYATGNTADDDVFGYQERYAEYRYKPNTITGVFRSNHTQSLDSWHLAQDFASLPTLNDTFIQETPPIDRVVALPDEPNMILDTYIQLRCARPMPLYGVPGFIDHF